MGLVRIFLALVVATAHFQQMVSIPNHFAVISPLFTLGFHSAYAVLFFYVISGFLITFALTEHYVGRPDGTAKFYKARFIRIFSLYWPLVICAMILMPTATQDFFSGSMLDKFTNIFLLGADWNLDFGNYPQFDTNSVPTGLHPAWTLGAEMTFYLLAPFLVRHWRIVAGLFVASLLLRGALVFHLGTRIVERWTYYFAPATFLFFLGGQGICLLSRHHAWLKDHRFGCGLMAGAFLIMLVTPDTGFDIRRLWISIACFTAGLPGFFDATKNIRWMNVLGNLSYPIYLVHPMAALLVAPPIYYEFVRLGLNSQPYLVPMLVTFLLASTLLGLLAHLVVEQPVAAVMKAVLTGPRRPRPRDAPV